LVEVEVDGEFGSGQLQWQVPRSLVVLRPVVVDLGVFPGRSGVTAASSSPSVGTPARTAAGSVS